MGALERLKAAKAKKAEEAAAKKAAEEAGGAVDNAVEESSNDPFAQLAASKKKKKADVIAEETGAGGDIEDVETGAENNSGNWERILQQETDFLAKFGLKINKIEADGACLFRAFANQYFNDENKHDEVRQACVDFMEKNPDDFSPFIDVEAVASIEEESGGASTSACSSMIGITDSNCFSFYCKTMRKPKTWGGEMEIQALSKCYNVNVTVHVPSFSEEFQKSTSPDADWEGEDWNTGPKLEALGGGSKPKKKKKGNFLDNLAEDFATKTALVDDNAILSPKKTDSAAESKAETESLKTSILAVIQSSDNTSKSTMGNPVLENYHFPVSESPSVQLSYHPEYHLGKHYNSVSLSDESASCEKHPPVPKVAEAMQLYMKQKASGGVKKEVEETGKKKLTAKDIFG